MVYAGSGEGDHNAVDPLSDRVGIEQEVLTARVELLVSRQNVIDLVAREHIFPAHEVRADLHIGSGAGIVNLDADLISLERSQRAEHFGSELILRVTGFIVRVEIEQRGFTVADVLHVEIALTGCDRGKSQLHLRTSLRHNESAVICLHNAVVKALALKGDISAVKTGGDLFDGPAVLKAPGRGCHGVSQENFLPLGRSESIELLTADRAVICVPQRERAQVLINGVGRILIQRRV